MLSIKSVTTLELSFHFIFSNSFNISSGDCHSEAILQDISFTKKLQKAGVNSE
jgi:hypothetical protein